VQPNDAAKAQLPRRSIDGLSINRNAKSPVVRAINWSQNRAELVFDISRGGLSSLLPIPSASRAAGSLAHLRQCLIDGEARRFLARRKRFERLQERDYDCLRC
jgi:hypothetical protein